MLAGKMWAPLEPLEWKLKAGVLFIMVVSNNNRCSFQIRPLESRVWPLEGSDSESQMAATFL